MTDEKILEVRDAAFSYDGSRMIFENVNLSVDKGEVLCIPSCLEASCSL